MSIGDSIFAQVGRPLGVATAVRIPIHGPFNTLVVVHLRGASVIPGISINTGAMVRTKLSSASTFVLVGFDQRSPPVFQHSTTGFLSYIATSNDATFTYAIDAVSAHFDEVGRYWVDYDAAMLNDLEITAGSCSLTSWVLVNEPQEQSHAWATSTAPLTKAAQFGLPLKLKCKLTAESGESVPARNTHIEKLVSEHANRVAADAPLFAQVAAEVNVAQEALFSLQVNDFEARRNHYLKLTSGAGTTVLSPADDGSACMLDAFRQRLKDQALATEKPLLQMNTRCAQAQALQPVRDLFIDGVLLLSEDRKLDIVGAPYPEVWIHKSGNTLPHTQANWAEPGDGSFGFDHSVVGTVDGRQSNIGAGIFIQFVPRIAPGVAQIRPFLPFAYAWSNISFRSREDTTATFGIRVWSWNSQGGDCLLEQDYRYSIWNDTSIANYFATSNNPQWLDNQDDGIPGLDEDHAFIFGKEAPYFKTRPDRIYSAVIWCSGVCFSVSAENRPGQSIGKLFAKMPWVVIGYQ
jgi:hypothetical protein